MKTIRKKLIKQREQLRDKLEELGVISLQLHPDSFQKSDLDLKAKSLKLVIMNIDIAIGILKDFKKY